MIAIRTLFVLLAVSACAFTSPAQLAAELKRAVNAAPLGQDAVAGIVVTRVQRSDQLDSLFAESDLALATSTQLFGAIGLSGPGDDDNGTRA
ncbi:MAG: hypothetical protein AAFS11_05595, partial [Planctomycetota bacterium]